MLDRFLTVLPITLSFLVRFLSVKYQIEALIMLYTLVRGQSVWSSFRSGQRFGQTLVKRGQPWSKLVKLGQNSPNSGKCAPDPILRFFWGGRPPSGRLGSVNISVKPWSNLVNPGQTWSNSGKCAPDPVLSLFDMVSPRQIRPGWFGLPYFAC